jgi:hypothetical protein
MNMTKRTDVWDLPEAQLKKSSTWIKHADDFGMCTRCKEHIEVLGYCCTGVTYFEGGTIDSDGLWQEIEAELEELAASQAYDLKESELKGN